MHLHILGICGTFMGGIALLARALGHQVTGSDANVYPPMSTQLEAAGIDLVEGYGTDQLDPAPDVVVVPTGDGVIASGLAKGFADLVRCGLLPRMPRLVAVQPERSGAIAPATARQP